MRDEHWAHRLLSVGRVPAPPTVPEVRGSIWWWSLSEKFVLLGSVSGDGIAQLTYRDSLGDIEACFGSIGGKLYHMGFRGKVARSTLADANEARDWRIYADLHGF
jgi:uncharacterized protein DUF4372